jgi:uncharacterized protein (TIGR00369 family)
MTDQIKHTVEGFNDMGQHTLPGHLGIVITGLLDNGEVNAEMPVQPFLLAPNGYLHAGSVITLADTAAGFGCWASLPPGASGFTTIELKSNHLSTAREGTLVCVARAIHRGKTTQVWDSVVKNKANDQTIAVFRCTQMILYPKK